MSKQYKIKWSEQDLKELNRTVKNFNAKITRLSKKDPSIANKLPEKVTTQEIKNLITSRQDLKRELHSLQRFSKRGAETIVNVPNNDNGLQLTKWQRTEMNRRVGIINRKRQARLERIINTEMTSRGKSLGYTRGQVGMGSLKKASLKPMQAFTRTMSRTELNMKWKSIRKQSQNDFLRNSDLEMRDQYVASIIKYYDYESVKDIIDEIMDKPIDEFMAIFEAEGGTFEWVSPPGAMENAIHQMEEYMAWEEGLRSQWKSETETKRKSKK